MSTDLIEEAKRQLAFIAGRVTLDVGAALACHASEGGCAVAPYDADRTRGRVICWLPATNAACFIEPCAAHRPTSGEYAFAAHVSPAMYVERGYNESAFCLDALRALLPPDHPEYRMWT